MSSADCSDAGVCCLNAQASVASVVGACQASCAKLPQLCSKTAECGEAGACSMLSCTVDAGGISIPVTLKACGTFAGCQATH